MALHFDAVGSQAAVRFNGKEIGGFTGDGVPFEIDVPSNLIKCGRENEVYVTVKDWHVFLDDPDWAAKQHPGPYFGPVNLGVSESMEARGLYQPVELRAYPRVCMSDVFVTTSLVNRTLTAQVEVRSDLDRSSDLAVAAVIYDGDSLVKTIASVGVTTVPNGTTVVNVSAPWPDPILWTPDMPRLYHLETRLLDGTKAMDVLRTRFGFREFSWNRIPLPAKVTKRRPYPCAADVSPEDVLFWFNGNPIQFRQTVTIGSNYVYLSLVDRNWLAQFYTNLKRHNINFLRTSAAVVPPAWLDLADEMGLFIQTETGVFGSVGNLDINNPVMYDNWERQILAMVRRDRNHPSLAAYAMENEYCRQAMQKLGTDQRRKNEFRILDIEAKCRALDDTRPYVYEGDFNMQGWAEIACYHYPGPEANWGATAFPNVCWWAGHQNFQEIASKDISPQAAKFIKAQQDTADLDDLYWHRDRPCMIGERSWFKADKPEARGFDFVAGERDSELDRVHQGMAVIARFNAEIDRIQQISRVDIFHAVGWISQNTDGFAPPRYPELAECVKQAFSPLIAVPHEYDHHFYSGDRMVRHYSIRNDTYRSLEIQGFWRLEVGGQERDIARKTFLLGTGRQCETEVEFEIPRLLQVTPAKLTIDLTSDAGDRYSREMEWKIYPSARRSLNGHVRVLVDPGGEAARRLAKMGVHVREVNIRSLNSVRDGLLIVSEGAGEKLSLEEAENIKAFVERGGGLLILPQHSWPPAFAPAPTFREHFWPSNERVTFAFPAQLDHPILRGFDYDDFTLWRYDHIVADTCFDRPNSEALSPIILAGNHTEPGGLCYSTLVEAKWGKGTVVFCQMNLLEKADKEPVAAALLDRLLLYLTTPIHDET